MEIGILGPLTVTRDGCDVPIAGAKPRALVAVFTLRRNQVVPTPALIDELWGDDPPATATKIVHTYVSQLRKVLGVDMLQSRAGGYLFRAAPDEVDAARFESLLALGRQALAGGRPEAASDHLRSALSLWRGLPLAEFRLSEGAAAEVERLQELKRVALESGLAADVACGAAATAIPELQALVSQHPLRESLRASLMLALYRTGRQADALAVYADTRVTLVDQLGVDPSQDLQRLQARILAHDPKLDHVEAPQVVAPIQALTPVEAPSGRNLAPTLSASPDPPAPQAVAADFAAVVAGEAAPPRQAAMRHQWWQRRRTRRPLVVAACLGAVCLSAFGLPAADSPRALAAAQANSVGFIDLGGQAITRDVTLAGSPTAIAVDGSSLWALEPAQRSVVRIDADRGTVVDTIIVGDDPSAVLAEGGSVWVANHDDGTVSQISPETNGVVNTIPVGVGPVALAAGFGSVWVTNSDDRTLTRIDERSGKPLATIHTNAVGRGIVADGHSVWITDETTGRLVGVDPATDTVSTSIAVGNGPTGITTADGMLWVADTLSGTVSRVDPTAQAVTGIVPGLGDPSDIDASPGAVWVSSPSGSRVVRIDPNRATIAGSTALGGPPEALVATRSGVWVSVQAGGISHRGGRLVVASDGFDSIDVSAFDVYTNPIELAYDTLTTQRFTGGSAGTQIVPDLAVSLPQPVDGGRSITFQLRPGIRYSNGQPLQAIDFRLGLERLFALQSDLATQFANVVGADRCTGKRCDLSAGVTAKGASTVTFHLTAPDPQFLDALTFLIPAPPGTPWHDTGTVPIPGTGPYAITSFVPNHLITFERNRYFDPALGARPDGYPDEVDYLLNISDTDAASRVAAGTVDVAQLVSYPPAARQLALQHPGQVHTVDLQTVLFAFLNTKSPPFDDVRVRQAVNFAIDREHLSQLFGTALARPTCQIVPPTASGYRPYCPYTVDPTDAGVWVGPDLARARALVDASGTKGQAVAVWTFSDFADEAKAVSDVLNQLGYRSTVHEIADAAAYFDALTRPEIQAGMLAWFDTPLAWDNLSTLTCDFGGNVAHFCDPALDAEIHQLGQTEPSDPQAATGLAARIDQQITDQAPWVPLLSPPGFNLTSARVGNYQSERGRLLIDQLWVK
jgi:peptide/nickel transport system substrate-binding protein